MNLNQGDSFTPTEGGTYTITASFQGQFGSRIVTVAGAPDAPTNVSGVVGAGTSIDVSWDAPADDGGSPITGYRVERDAQTGPGGWIEVTADTGSSSTTFNDSTVSSGESYRYRISAINALGTGPVSSQSGFIGPVL